MNTGRTYRVQRAALTGLAGVMLAILVGCTGGPQTSDSDVQVLSLAELDEVRAKERTVLVDVRKAESFAEGHLPGAVNIPFKDLRRRHAAVNDAKRIVVYGENWSDPLSIAGAKRLLALGYKNVYEFKGGVEFWTDDDRELVTGEAPSEPEPDGAD